MKRKLLYIFLALIVAGCSSKIAYGPSGAVEKASNYTINETETLDQKGKVTSRSRSSIPFVPDRWYSDALDKLGPLLSGFASVWKTMSPIPIPSPTPTPTPSPTPSPTPTPAPKPTPYPAPGPAPVPGPTPPPVASSVFKTSGNVITLDMNTLSGSMRKAGFQGRDTALWYTMAYIYAYGPGGDLPELQDGEMAVLNTQRQAIFNWFDAEVMKVKSTMLTYPALSLVAISNDGFDMCGFRLGPPILERLKEFGSRVTLGTIFTYPESDKKK